MDAVPDVRNLYGLSRSGGHVRRQRDVREYAPVRTAELQRAVGASRDPIPVFVHAAVVPPTEQCEIRQRRGAAGSPMSDVMALGDPHTAAREAAAVIPVPEGTP